MCLSERLWETPSNLPNHEDPLPTSPSMGRGQSPSPTNEENTPEVLPIEGEMREGQRGSWGDLFNGVPYTEIVSVLEEQMGGKPEHGSRNNFIFSMACHLRYVTNDDPEWIASILPTYGEARDKWMATIRSACARSQTKTMPRIMRRTLAICKQRLEDNSVIFSIKSTFCPYFFSMSLRTSSYPIGSRNSRLRFSSSCLIFWIPSL